MQLTFRFLILLLAAVPAVAITPVAPDSYLLFAAALLLLTTASTVSRPDLAAVLELLRRLKFVLAFPIIWMLLQILPVPLWAANPIWRLAATAFAEPGAWGHISVDPRRTLAGLIVYLGFLAFTVSAALLTRDRRRAETIFFVLLAISTLLAAEALLNRLLPLIELRPPAGPSSAAFGAASGLTVILSSASMVMAIERYFTRRETEYRSILPLLNQSALSLLAVSISVAAFASSNFAVSIFPVGIGVSSILFIAIARRLSARSWPAVILFSLLCLFVVATFYSGPRASSPLVLLSSSAALESSISVTVQAMAATPWLGNGVGGFSSLAHAYAEFGVAFPINPPTTVALLTIEWGQLGLIALALISVQLFVFVFRAAIRRGRDSVFASAAAGTVLSLATESLIDTSLLSPVIWTMAAVILGLGIAQSSGRTRGFDD